MRSSFLAVAALATGVFAAPKQGSNGDCLTDSSAYHVAQNFQSLIASYSNASAAAFLTTDFTDYSDSVNELINNGCPNGPAPLGSATFTGLTAFQAGQGGQPAIPFEILNVWHNCNTVTLRWKSSTPGTVQPEQQVTGIVVMETVCSSGAEKHKIKTVYSEFNSGAWLYDLGVFVPTCNASASKLKREVVGGARKMI